MSNKDRQQRIVDIKFELAPLYKEIDKGISDPSGAIYGRIDKLEVELKELETEEKMNNLTLYQIKNIFNIIEQHGFRLALNDKEALDNADLLNNQMTFSDLNKLNKKIKEQNLDEIKELVEKWNLDINLVRKDNLIIFDSINKWLPSVVDGIILAEKMNPVLDDLTFGDLQQFSFMIFTYTHNNLDKSITLGDMEELVKIPTDNPLNPTLEAMMSNMDPSSSEGYYEYMDYSAVKSLVTDNLAVMTIKDMEDELKKADFDVLYRPIQNEIYNIPVKILKELI